MAKKVAIVNKKGCVACGVCISVCPLKLIHVEAGVFASILQERCVGCGKCAKECPASVITIQDRNAGGM